MKKSFIYLMLLAVAAALGLVNVYLWHLQKSTQHRIADLQQQVGLHLRENKALNDRNDALRVDVENLRSPESYYSYEEKAREDYGLIGKNETYFVLPAQEIAGIPDVPGLVEKERKTENYAKQTAPTLPSNARSLNTELTLESVEEDKIPPPSHKTVEPIPVTPVPLQLESLQ
ncbi:MAG: septum formation initiator family protein [Cardiobacteriaceae bacterium]|nr:septum formation initiator family protein [Cardiobacteriaceae bacterium]